MIKSGQEDKAMISEKVDYLATVSFFSHLKKDELPRLANKSRYCAFKFGGEIIYRLTGLYGF
jgi:hypothetical protein